MSHDLTEPYRDKLDYIETRLNDNTPGVQPELEPLFRELLVVTRAALNLSSGRCPACEAHVGDFKVPSGPFAPELFATLREQGLDPSTGHRKDCTALAKINLRARYKR